MKRLTFIFAILLLPNLAAASGHEAEHHAAPAETAVSPPKTESEKTGPVAAVDTKNARPVHVNELIQTGGTTLAFVDNANTRIELAPHSVGEFRVGEGFRLLRGSACLESKGEGVVNTTSAKLNFVGRVVISYDHKEKSTSAFVLQGQARMLNAHDDAQSLRLDRFRGATMVVGEVIPQLIRQLDVGSLEGWLKGYAWPEATRQEWLSGVPDGSLAVKPAIASHLEEVKLENYFSAIDNDDEVEAPDYYEKKFSDPDKVVAEANSVKEQSTSLKPEEAALISLPSTKIDLGFSLTPEVLTVKQKQKEVIEHTEAKASRSLASVKPLRAKAKTKPESDQGDPEISSVLNRLRNIQSRESENPVSPQMDLRTSGGDTRGPASIKIDAVPDTVYDYSQNF